MKKHQILIADSDPAVRKMINLICVRFGWDVDIAFTGSEAVDLVKQRSHQIFVIDVQMPGLSGLELTNIIMKHETAPAIIMLAGNADVDQAVIMLKAGVFNYLQKDTVSVQQLKKYLKRAALYHEKRSWSNAVRRERDKTFRDINAANKRFLGIMDLSSDLILILNSENMQIIDCNAAASEQLGYSHKEILSLHFNDICHSSSASLLDDVKRNQDIDDIRTYEEVLIKKNGDSFPGEISIEHACIETGDYMSMIVRDISVRKRLEKERQHYFDQLNTTLEQTIQMIALTVEKRDPFTAGHQQRVSNLSAGIAETMGLEQDRIDGVRMGALIHDIGKINISAEILSKAAKLSDIEYRIVKLHTTVGFDIVKEVEFPWPISKIVVQHHERIDGSGYPFGLKDDEITLEAKIVGVADVVEAMDSHRPYRPSRGIEMAIREISSKKGIIYDSVAVEACLIFLEKNDYKF